MNYEKSCLFNCLFPCPLYKQARSKDKALWTMNTIICPNDCVNCAYMNILGMHRLQKPLLLLLLSVSLTCVTFCPPCPRGQSHSHEPEWWRCTPSAVRSPPGRGPSAGPHQTYRSAPLPRTEPPARGCWKHRSPLETRKKGGRQRRQKEEEEGRG